MCIVSFTSYKHDRSTLETYGLFQFHVNCGFRKTLCEGFIAPLFSNSFRFLINTAVLVMKIIKMFHILAYIDRVHLTMTKTKVET